MKRSGNAVAVISAAALTVVLIGCATTGIAGTGKKAERARFGEIERVDNWLAGADAAGNSTAAKGLPVDGRVIQPIFVHASIAEHHVIAWFDGHEKYEAVEAFVYSKDRIRAILTRHDNSQIDAWGFPDGETPETVSAREHYESKITFKMAPNGKNAELSMKTPEGEDLFLSYVGQDKPDPEYGGMTDPGLHSPDGGLPILFRDASSTSAKESFVRIGGIRYAIPEDPEISAPPYFIAYTAFLSNGYHSFILSTFPERKVSLALPEPGVATGNRDGSTGIVSIAPEGRDRLRFNPPLPSLASLADGDTASSRFAVFFEGSTKEEVYGDAIVARSGNVITLSFRPAYPAWARAARSMVYTIELSDDAATVSASMERK